MKLEEMKTILDFAHSNANRYGRQDSEIIDMCILLNNSTVVGIHNIVADKGKIVFVPIVDLKIDVKELLVKAVEIEKDNIKDKENMKLNSENIILKRKIAKLEGKLNASENTIKS